jgi:hypothetical protein
MDYPNSSLTIWQNGNAVPAGSPAGNAVASETTMATDCQNSGLVPAGHAACLVGINSAFAGCYDATGTLLGSASFGGDAGDGTNGSVKATINVLWYCGYQ